MQKSARFVLAILFVLGLVLMSAPQRAQAREIENKTNIAGGSWTGGTDVNVTTLAEKAPTWLQLLTNGVRVTEAGKICHPFRGGQFGWVGEIRQYKSGEWFKLKTTNDWVPNKEGVFMSCAEAPAAGTYGLFGYYIAPAGVTQEASIPCEYDTSTWTGALDGSGNTYYLKVLFGQSIPIDTTVSFVVTSVSGDIDPVTMNGLYGSTGLVDEEGDFWGHFSDKTFSPTGEGVWYVYFRVTAGGCSKDLVASFT